MKRQLSRQKNDVPLDDGAEVIREAEKTRIVLGPLKTENVYRRLYLPNFVADHFRTIFEWQKEQRNEYGKDFNPHGFVFCIEEGAAYDNRVYQDKWYGIVRAAEIDHANFHSLRHTFATRCL